MTEQVTFRTRLLNAVLSKQEVSDLSESEFSEVKEWFAALLRDQAGAPGKINAREFIKQRFRYHLESNGIVSGKIAEIGGPFNSFAADFPEFEFEFLSLFPVEGRDDVTVADITNCDYLKSEQFDAIFSISVLEHVSRPWLAGAQITRLLKPNGIAFHMAPFSYFYHGAPADFWRFTPDAMSLVFSELEPIESSFYSLNRRRDNRGSEANPVDKDGGEAFAVDAFGGWRESWHSYYCGKKSADYLTSKLEMARKQTIVNLVRRATADGASDDEAARIVQAGLRDYEITVGGDLVRAHPGKGTVCSVEDVTDLWKTRGKQGIRPSYARFVQWEIFDGPSRLAKGVPTDASTNGQGPNDPKTAIKVVRRGLGRGLGRVGDAAKTIANRLDR